MIIIVTAHILNSQYNINNQLVNGMDMYVYTHMCTYTYIYIHIYRDIHIYTYVYACILFPLKQTQNRIDVRIGLQNARVGLAWNRCPCKGKDRVRYPSVLHRQKRAEGHSAV